MSEYELKSTDSDWLFMGPTKYRLHWYAKYVCWVYNFCENRWGDPDTSFYLERIR